MVALAFKKGRDETQQFQRSQHKISKSSSSDGNDPIIQMNVSVETPESKRIPNSSQSSYPTIKDPIQIANDGIAITNSNNTSLNNMNNDHPRLTPNTLLSDGRMLGVVTGDTVGPPASVNTLQSVDTTYQHAHTLEVQNQGFSGRSDSFPPGHIGVAKSVTDDTLRTYNDNVNDNVNVNVNATSPGNAVLQHAAGLNRPPSPPLFNPTQGLKQLMNNDQINDLQGPHHGGVLDPASCLLRTGQIQNGQIQNVQMEIVIDPSSGNAVQTVTVQTGVSATDVAAYLVDQLEQGRSSASNSDIDSESDDISFDDSASDRSDGSDFDTGGSHAGLSDTAARVMALNRMQQQHRREQYLQDRQLRQMPPDSEYQSGDSSIDSMMAEDSGGSDSSSSDFID